MRVADVRLTRLGAPPKTHGNIMAYQRVEILTGTERRRNYAPAEKMRIGEGSDCGRGVSPRRDHEGRGPAVRDP